MIENLFDDGKYMLLLEWDRHSPYRQAAPINAGTNQSGPRNMENSIAKQNAVLD